MKLVMSALGTALAVAVAAAGPAEAQAPAATPAPAPTTQRQLKLSPKAQKALLDLQTAVKAKNSAAIPGLIAAAQAVVQSQDDRYALASLQLQAAADANNYPALVAAADAMTAAGASPSETRNAYQFAAQRFAAQKQYAPAGEALNKWIALDPNNSDALLLKSDLMYQQHQVAESTAALTQAITRQKAAGTTVPESWYQVRVAHAYEAKLPAVYDYTREWVQAYPTAQHWRDTVNIYRNMSGLDRSALIDMFRLSRATKSLAGESDYSAWAQALLGRGYPSVALSLLQEGAASGSISLTSPGIAPLVAQARAKAPQERAALLTNGKAALSASTARPAMLAGDGFLDAGDFAQAATLYRAALTKPGVDKDVANLRLGMALAQAGDKAGATAALQAVSGSQSQVAQYWMTYLASRG